MPASPDILVIGAGVLGLCTAVELTRRGHPATVIDPGGPNASSVAAGMIAPALESALDAAAPERAALLRAAGDLWPEFAAALGITLNRTPAEWRGEGADRIADRLSRLGFAFDRDGDRLIVPGDWQVDPEPAMQRLRAGLEGRVMSGDVHALERVEDRWRASTESAVVEAEIIVLATGAAGAIPGLPEATARSIAAIQPIRGQIGRLDGLAVSSVVRGHGAYLAPGAGGAVVGATMGFGRRDLDPDAAEGEALLAAARRLQDDVGERATWRVGVRGATADGLPLAGASSDAGLHLALAPRRNGWLLGPLVGRTVADGIEGMAPGPHAAALDPLRFSPAG